MRDTFGSRLKKFRTMLDLTQQQLADKSGVSRKQISDFEMDVQKNPRKQTIEKLANALGIESEKLISSNPLDEILELSIASEAHEKLSKLAELNNQSVEDVASEILKRAILSEMESNDTQPHATIDLIKDKKIEQLEEQVANSMKMIDMMSGYFEAMINGNHDEYMKSIFKKYPNIEKFYREKTNYPFDETDNND